jgi:hypothetical protein
MKGMDSRGSKRVWWWLLFFLVLGALIGYLLRGDLGKESEKPALSEKTAPSSENTATFAKEEPTTASEPTEAAGESSQPSTTVPITPLMKKTVSTTELSLSEFFAYLDQQPSIRHLDLQGGTKERFKIILKKLSSRLPVPAGEGIDPRILTANVYHFFRTLDRQDIRLIKEIIRHERENMEMDLRMFFRWFMEGDGDPDLDRLRPSLATAYPYAGYLLNTIGGRAYLLRRPSTVRVLLTYYSLLIAYQADKERKNSYGIDLYPYVRALEEEITHYPDLQYQQEYLEKLDHIRQYYVSKR